MEMNYFRNILIVPTGLNKYVDIGMCFFFLATPCLNSINQLVSWGRGMYVWCNQAAYSFIILSAVK